MIDLAPKRSRQVGCLVLGSDFKALAVIRSLGSRGVRCAVVDSLPRSAWFSRYVRKRFRWGTALADPDLIEFLLKLAVENQFEGWLLIPAQDDAVELVARHRERLSARYRLVTQDWELLRWAHDKRLLYRVAAEVGLSLPKTWYPADEGDLAALLIEYPAIIKPSISIGLQHATGRKALPAHGVDQLMREYRRAASVDDSGGLMVQEVIPGDGRAQFSVAAYCKEGETLVAMTARRSRQYPADYGLSSSFVEAVDVPELLPPAERLLRRLQLTGMVEVEFKRDPRDGRDKLLDVNVRPWGWHALCIASGLDFPFMQYCDSLGLPLPTGSIQYGGRWRRFITDLPAATQEIRAGTITAASYVRSLFGKTVPSVFDARDPIPLLGDLAVAIWRVLWSRRSTVPDQRRTQPVVRYEPTGSSRSL